MYHCPILGQNELESLRLIENVVRQGRVAHIGAERIELEAGSIPTDRNQLYVDCTGEGIRRAPARPIFEPNRITVQQVRTCQPTFNAAVVAFVEAVRDDENEKNRLCPPHLYPDSTLDWLSVTAIAQRTQALWFDQPDLMAWLERSRLNLTRGLIERAADPKMQPAITRLFTNREPAINNLEKLLAQTT